MTSLNTIIVMPRELPCVGEWMVGVERDRLAARAYAVSARNRESQSRIARVADITWPFEIHLFHHSRFFFLTAP